MTLPVGRKMLAEASWFWIRLSLKHCYNAQRTIMQGESDHPNLILFVRQKIKPIGVFYFPGIKPQVWLSVVDLEILNANGGRRIVFLKRHNFYWKNLFLLLCTHKERKNNRELLRNVRSYVPYCTVVCYMVIVYNQFHKGLGYNS